jgi:hypothetical protein
MIIIITKELEFKNICAYIYIYIYIYSFIY